MHNDDRIVIEDLPLGFGRVECIECGEIGERRLPSRFPHICHACLFPPARPDDPDADPPEFLPVVHLIDSLLQRNVTIGAMKPDERRMD